MREQKDGDPKDAAEHPGGTRIVPGHGMGFAVPGPITAGAPKPEPEERWTLGPARHPDQTPEDDEDGDTSPDATGPVPPGAERRPR
jgi:hypothetical protein